MADEAKEHLIRRVEEAEQRILRLAIRDRSNWILSVNLSIQQLRVLMLLSLEGDLSAHELAEILGVGLTTLTGVVDRLEDRDLVCRRLDPRDRRVRRIDLTDEGRRMINDFNDAGREHRRRLFHRLDPRILANLAEAVDALYEAAVAEIEEGACRDHPPGRL